MESGRGFAGGEMDPSWRGLLNDSTLCDRRCGPPLEEGRGFSRTGEICTTCAVGGVCGTWASGRSNLRMLMYVLLALLSRESK
jgi:hypothetical protein